MMWSRRAIRFVSAVCVFVSPVGADPDPQVHSKAIDPGFIPIFVVSDDSPAFVPPHPPLDQIPPMPMPEPGDIVGPPGSPSVYMHDADSGMTWELPLSAPSGANGGQGGSASFGAGFDSDTIPGDVRPGEGFGSMSLIGAGTRATFPWSVNVKLAMRFTDTGGNTRWFVCSGSMQDPEVVLCAAHCVYARNPNGINIFNWANEIYVYPGWDGNGNIAPPSNAQHQPFGYARGTWYLAGSDYINNGNFDRDCGVIRVTRCVGSLTGWWGWAWGGSCPSGTYNNASYPAENCHNGREMYYWSGTIDACPNNQFQLNTGGGCLDTVWGGMSGSAMYYISGSDRYAHAVASTSNRNDRGYYCKLWEQFVNDMGSFKADARGAAFDLQAMRYRMTQTTIQAGTAVGGTIQHLAVNPTNGAKNANHVFRVYLSSNDNISSSDTLLSTQNYNWNFGAMSSVTVNMGGFTTPITTTPGTYWIGLEYDAATDIDFSNNGTDGWDAQQVTITLGAPDAATYVAPANGSTNRPITQDLDWSAAARASSYDVYFGTDSTPDAGEYQGTTASTLWALPNLANATTYYWRIDSRGTGGVTAGPVWSFTTRSGCACQVDLTCDGNVNTNDFFQFLTYYQNQDARADFSPGGGINTNDFFAFLAAYQAGC